MGMTMKLAKGYIIIGAMMLGIAAQPAFANNKEKVKRPEVQAPCTECCKPAVRSMSETTPTRKNECAKIRRILM
jgi:hypothetical protein